MISRAFPRCLALLLALPLLLSAAGPMQAQEPQPPSTPPAAGDAPPAPARQPVAPAVRPIEPGAAERTESWKLTLDQIEIDLSREGLDDSRLLALEREIEPIRRAAIELADRLAERLRSLQDRLRQLAPPAAEGGGQGQEDGLPADGEASALREAVAEIDAVLRKARLIAVQAEQLQTRIAESRRTSFAGSLAAKQPGLFAPSLWEDALAGLPGVWKSVRIILGDAVSASRAKDIHILPALAALVVGLLAAFLPPVLARRLLERPRREEGVTRLARLSTAVWRTALYGIVPGLALYAVVAVALEAGLVPQRLASFCRSAGAGLGMLVFVDALARAVLSPGKPEWRLVDLPDPLARQTGLAVVLAVFLALAGHLLTRLVGLTAATPQIAVLGNALFSLAIAVTLALTLARIAQARADTEEPVLLTRHERYWRWLRGLIWILLAVIAGAAIGGYIALAAFLSAQIVFGGVILALLSIFVGLIDALTEAWLSGESQGRTVLARAIGIERASAKQFIVLASGIVRFALIALAALLLLLPWGFDTRQWSNWFGKIFFGFRIGEITISFSTILSALLLFLIGFAATRAFQSWLTASYMPHTRLDIGLRNSIGTALGYVGIFLSAALAMAYVGLDLASLAIVAGALSLGVGFGLQSIVNNFVSGLILLAERPIKEGDWIKVGTAEGNVRRISIRATELVTFDRATVVVPNSDLISGTVTNMTNDNRIGRLMLQVGVGCDSDPEQVREVLLKAVEGHPDVLKRPEPRVVFEAFGKNVLNFTLYVHLRDVEKTLSTRSDLNFAIFRGLKEAGIAIP